MLKHEDLGPLYYAAVKLPFLTLFSMYSPVQDRHLGSVRHCSSLYGVPLIPFCNTINHYLGQC